MDSYIVQCDESVALSILQHPSVVKPLGLCADRVLDDYEWWLIDSRLLVALKPEGKQVEVHIACKFRDRHSLRQSLTNGLAWLKSRGFETAWTTAPDNRKALLNLLMSLNFRAGEGRWQCNLL